MQVLSFSDFARRRGAMGRADSPVEARSAPPVVDRWAMLHSPSALPESDPFTDRAAVEADFWSDLQFRIAYPTHRMRHH